MSFLFSRFVIRARWPALILGGTLASIWLLNVTFDEPVKSEPVSSQWQVETQQVTFSEELVEARLYGRVETPSLITLTAPVTGYIDDLSVMAGQAVNKDDLLIQIDPRDQQLVVDQRQADVLDARARLKSEKLRAEYDRQALEQEKILYDSAHREYERQVSLKKQNLVADSQVETAESNLARQQLVVIGREQSVADHQNRIQQLQAQVQRAEAFLRQAQLDLDRSSITTPFNGYVAQLFVAVGERVRAGDSLGEIYPSAQTEIRAQIPERYLTEVRRLLDAGEGVRASVWQADEPITLYLDRLAAVVGEGRGGVDGLFRTFDQASLVMALGRPVVLTLHMPVSEPAIAIEPRSLYDDSFVYRVADDNTLEAVSASSLGSISKDGEEWLLITAEALQEGDRLLKTRIANAVSGLAVVPAPQNGEDISP